MTRTKAVIQHYIGKYVYFINNDSKTYRPIISTARVLSCGPEQVVLDYNGKAIMRYYDQIAIKYERGVSQESE